MTDTDTDTDAEEEIDAEELLANQQPPEMNSFEITATRVFEIDFAEPQLQGLMQQTGAETVEEAIEQVFLQRETQHVEPQQKLLFVDIQADGSSDD